MSRSLGNLKIGILVNNQEFRKSLGVLERDLNRSARKMQAIGKQMAMAITLPIVGGVVAAMSVFKDFEQSMAAVKAVSGATDTEFKMLNNTAKELGRTTRYTASQVGGLMLNYAKLGFTSDQIDKITGATLRLAQATGEDLAQTAEVAGGTLRSFGLEAEDIQRVVDVMARSFSTSALNLERFANSMPKVAAVAKSLGYTLEETTAMLGTLVNRGIQSETAGTMLRQMFLKAKKEGFSFQGALDDIASSSDKAGTALKYFNERSIATAITLAENQQATKELVDMYNNAGGSVEEMARIMDNTFQGALFRTKSALQGIAIEIGETLGPALGRMADKISAAANRIAEMDKDTIKLILRIGLTVAAIGPAVFIFGKLTGAIAGVVAVIKGLALWMAKGFALASLPVTAVVAALAIGAVLVAKNWDVIKGKIIEVQNEFAVLYNNSQEFRGVIEYIGISLRNAINATKALGKILMETVKALAKGFFAFTQNDFLSAGRAANDWFKSVAKVGGEFGEQTYENFIKGFSRFKNNKIQYIFDEDFKGLEEKTSATVERLKKLLSGALDDDDDDGGGGSGIDAAKNSLAALNEELTKLTTKINSADLSKLNVNEFAADWKRVNEEIKKVSDRIKEIQTGRKVENGVEALPSKFLQLPDNLLDDLYRVTKGFDDIGDAIERVLPDAQKLNEIFKSQSQIDLEYAREQFENLGNDIRDTKEIAADALMVWVDLGKGIADAMKTAIEDGIYVFADAIAEGLAGGANLGKTIFMGLLSVIEQFAQTIIKAGAAALVTGLAIQSLNPATAGLAIAAGIGLLAFAKSQKNKEVKGYAKGGIFSGEQLIRVGEYSGARYNPEVVAPLNKLKDMIGGGGQMQVVVLDSQISGTDIMLTYNRSKALNKRI